MRGVVVFTQVFLHTYVGHPFTMAFSAPHLHAAGLIMLGGQEGRAPSRINVDVVMREIGSVRLCEKNRLTAALVIALAIVQTIRTLAYCSRVGKDVHKRKVLGGTAYNNVGAPKQTNKGNNEPLLHLGCGQPILQINATVFGHHFVSDGLAVVVGLAIHAWVGCRIFRNVMAEHVWCHDVHA